MGSLTLTGENNAERTNQHLLFSSGLELADLVVNSGLLRLCWDAIWGLHGEINPNGETTTTPFSVKYKVSQLPKCTIIAFATSPTCTTDHLLEGERNLVSSAAIKETFPLFKFVCTKGSFSIHEVAITLFASLHEELSELKEKYDNAAPLIITGQSLGGSIASLFAISLLESVNWTATKQPLCITFGAPLIGDYGLQQAILRSTWNSCFLHVVANQDPMPRLFIAPRSQEAKDLTRQITDYKPFGTFLMCSDFGSTCIEDPLAISELLLAMDSESGEWQIGNYGSIFECLFSRMWFKGISLLDEVTSNSLRAALILQLEAIGIRRNQQTSAISTLIERMEEASLLCRKRVLDPAKKLNEVKITMAKLERYKKQSKDNNVGYYDSYKNRRSRGDMEVTKLKRILTNYWKKKVELERLPQKEGSSFKTRWLFAGTNYRRMVEPLDIADYYVEKEGQKNYKTEGRSRHYIQLEKWLEEEAKKPEGPPNLGKKQNVEATLTVDSCFWANVEEAIISCRLLKDEETSDLTKELSRESLIEFEKYVMKLIKNYSVSPEIFLSKSTFMQWWKECQGIITMRSSFDLPLTDFMRTGKFKEYSSGCL